MEQKGTAHYGEKIKSNQNDRQALLDYYSSTTSTKNNGLTASVWFWLRTFCS